MPANMYAKQNGKIERVYNTHGAGFITESQLAAMKQQIMASTIYYEVQDEQGNVIESTVPGQEVHAGQQQGNA